MMQRSAVLVKRLLLELGSVGRMWHVPGLALVAEGVDGASRGRGDLGEDCVDAVAGPAVTGALRLWGLIEAELQRLGWTVTVDRFASVSSARCARYCSRTHEPEAERTDAFTMLDWSQSRCLVCGECHEEVVYAYPPTVLARQTANKAMQDGAKMILVVPLAVTSPHWQKLLRASVVANSERCMRVRGVQGPGERVARIRG